MHIRISFLAFLFLFLTSVTALAQDVYVTKTGEKYHRGTCHYLKSSKIKIKLDEAKKLGYTPCSVCKPSSGTVDTNDSTTRAVPKSPPVERKATASQCTAKTQAGSRCKRTTTNANGRCWQHQ